VASHRPPLRATTRQPEGRARHGRTGSIESCPRAAVWSGCARSTGCHTTPACKTIGDLIACEEPGRHRGMNASGDRPPSTHQTQCRAGSWPAGRAIRCCNEGSTAINYSAPRCRPGGSPGPRVSRRVDAGGVLRDKLADETGPELPRGRATPGRRDTTRPRRRRASVIP
jgi:hypothetical protein